MFCRKCGAEAKEGAIFCHICGSILKEENTQANVLDEQGYETVAKRKRETHILDTLNFVLALVSIGLMIIAFVPFVPVVALILGVAALIIAIILEIKKKYRFSLLSLYLAAGGILGNILLLIYFLG